MPNDKIKQFCQYFDEQLQNIGQLQHINSGENRLYQKILIVTLLDTLGHARLPDITKNRDRFISLIKECANWPDCQRISLPQLSISLSTYCSTNASQLTQQVKNKLQGWQDCAVYKIDQVDPLPKDDIFQSITVAEKKLVSKAEHAALLYEYRNHLVHEFREPGHGIESDNDVFPHYHSMLHTDMINIEADKDTWELVYPLGFFYTIAISILNNLKNHLQDNKLNPYDYYKFETLWSCK